MNCFAERLNNNFDSFSTTSTDYSCSSISCSNNGDELGVEPRYSSHNWENVTVAAPSVNIGSITVQNGTDVTFGNKIVFNTPVEINHLVVNYGEQNVDDVKNNNKSGKLTLRATAQYYYNNHPCKVCSIVSMIMVIVAASLIIVGYYFYPFGNFCLKTDTIQVLPTPFFNCRKEDNVREFIFESILLYVWICNFMYSVQSHVFT